jgi:hypothetical protein
MYDCGPKEPFEYMNDEILDKVHTQTNFLKEIGIAPVINLIGGEPTIDFDKFKYILDKIASWNVNITMSTNSWWMNSDKDTIKFFEIISKYINEDGKSGWETGHEFIVRLSNDPFHEKQRKYKDLRKQIEHIYYNVYKFNLWDKSNPWLLFQDYYDDLYYISPNGRGRNVSNYKEWIKKYGSNKCFCPSDYYRWYPNIHYELNGSISDGCGYGSMYDFGTVDDNILFISAIIQQYRKERNSSKLIYSCYNCREMVQEWKKNNLEECQYLFRGLNTFDKNLFMESF